MRNYIDIISQLSKPILTEASRGLLYRSKGDRFIQGPIKAPTNEIFFDHVEYFPGQPGEYEDDVEMAKELQSIIHNYPGLEFVNRPTTTSKAFAIITLKDKNGTNIYVLRFFQKIMNDMQGKWKNNELPGGWQLAKKSSLKAAYGLKPSDLLKVNHTYSNPLQIINELVGNEKMAGLMPGLQMLLGKQKPRFDFCADMVDAIQDDLGEIIAPIALMMGMINDGGVNAAKDLLFPNSSWTRGVITFPDGKTNGLVDSYITIDDVEIGISSKGKSGAKASIKNVFDGIELAKKSNSDAHNKALVKYKKQLDELSKLGQSSSVNYPIEYAVEHGMINQQAADNIKQLISIGATSLNEIDISARDSLALEQFTNRYNANTTASNYCVGYHILAALAKDVVNEINKDEQFGQMCLYFVNINPIVQIHLTVKPDGEHAKVTDFKSLFPPKFQGTVLVDSGKNYSATGVSGRFTFLYNPDKNAATEEISAQQEIKVSQIAVDKKIDDIVSGNALSTVKLGGIKKSTKKVSAPRSERD